VPQRESTEALIIGAGPAGLTAAIYLARFHRHVEIFDTGASRAKMIPVSHNCPGFTHGVSGPDFLERLREQAAEHGVHVREGEIGELRREERRFVARASSQDSASPSDDLRLVAERVILATGVADVLPQIDGIHDAICRGLVRLCAICDAYETRGKRVGVFGPAQAALDHARYMRSFAADVTALTPDADDPRREPADVRLIASVGRISIEGDEVRVVTPQGALAFDALYPVLGVQPNSQLAKAIGADCDELGYLRVDAHQRTNVPGLFAIGDVAKAINQIAVATGHAAIAATTIHNELERKPI